jgi:Nucleoside phosphorylase
MRILVTYAVQGEFTELKFPGVKDGDEVQIGYLRTGLGKVKSAFYLSEAINHGEPDLVINIGTAGTVNHQVGDIFVCRQFVDRDMQKLADFGVESEIDTSAMLAQKSYCEHWEHAPVANVSTSNGNLRNAEELFSLLKDYKVHIFAGHTHYYENRMVTPDIYEHNIGAACGACLPIIAFMIVRTA